MNRKSFGINGFTLKMIAVVSMLVDHIGATIVERILYGGWELVDADTWYQLQQIDEILRSVGRLAFPIYGFLIVEGFTYTRSIKKYLLRLGMFALISEIPFDLAFHGVLLEGSNNNVFLTLTLGLAAITAMDAVDQAFPLMETISWRKQICRCFLMIASVVVPVMAAYGLHTDYGMAGVLSIILWYVFRQQRLLAAGLVVLELGLTCGTIEFWAILILIPLFLYNGKQGPKAKWFFYLFYPVHLLILTGIVYAMGLDF